MNERVCIILKEWCVCMYTIVCCKFTIGRLTRCDGQTISMSYSKFPKQSPPFFFILYLILLIFMSFILWHRYAKVTIYYNLLNLERDLREKHI